MQRQEEDHSPPPAGDAPAPSGGRFLARNPVVTAASMETMCVCVRRLREPLLSPLCTKGPESRDPLSSFSLLG